ncbi:hypothetical protein [Streptomyces sp. SBT349]|uniref:hypothetical protein n=1 Tax=Streptomyces sp. SBT349 TaxID=1580539 RepID=UPI00066B0353|nr:hypothetical protein [Streptomyces sp. SBT349]
MDLFNSPEGRVSLGGILIGLGILVWQVAPWWYKGRKKKGKKGGDGEGSETSRRDWKDLLPLGAGLAYGSACVACVGGVLGWLAYSITNVNAAVGDRALAGTTGAQSQNMPQNTITYLNDGGSIIVALGLITLIVLWKKTPKKTRVELGAGLWAGASLALGAGASGVLGRTISPALNALGDPLVGVL